MPVVQFEWLESMYESGYFTNTNPEQATAETSPQENSQVQELPVEPEIDNEYHEKSTLIPTTNIINMEPPKIPIPTDNTTSDAPVNFPIAAKVCETSMESKLVEFNPLNDSEPNLEFDMTSQNNKLDLHVKLVKDAKSRRWQVKIQNLTREQIDLIAGPKLLPTLRKADAIVIEHDPHDDKKKPCSPDQLRMQDDSDNTKEPLKEVNKQTLWDSDNITTPTNKWPSRLATKNINYATMTLPGEASESESDEYKPNPSPSPKVNNKRYHSASRIAAQRPKWSYTIKTSTETKTDRNGSRNAKPSTSTPKTDHDDAEHAEKVPTTTLTTEIASDTPTENQRGKLNIKTVALPKRTHVRTFKCQECQFTCHSKKDRNTHHKDNHRPLTCAVCNEVFNTPSSLHRHKYRHSDLKFTYETCGKQYPFDSQLKDHQIKHLTGKGHMCFAKQCRKTCKNKSSLTRHLKTHEVKIYKCPEDGCDYSNPNEHNLKSHMIEHSDILHYSCTRCGTLFKHHMQMTRHMNNKVCSEDKWNWVTFQTKTACDNQLGAWLT